MATLTITIGGLISSKTISAADMTRLLAAYTVIHTTKNADGTDNVPTNQQLVDRFTASIVQGMADRVKSYEQEQAKASAAAAVASIVVT